MNLPSKMFALCLLSATPIGLAGAASAAPIGASLALHDAAGSAVQNVQWRGHWGGWGGPRWGWGGFAAGALVGGAFAAATSPYGYDYDYDYAPGYSNYYTGYGPGYYGYSYDPGYTTYSYRYSPGYSTYGYSTGDRDAAYCAQRYRSYDAASGTYLGYDGIRHSCP